MDLQAIYTPIADEMPGIVKLMHAMLGSAKNESIIRISQYVLASRGKMIRPALVMLSARAVRNHIEKLMDPPVEVHTDKLKQVAAAIELLHIASLVHDDVIDHSKYRHNKPTINYKNGNDVAIALGDYLYAQASDLIAGCGSLDVIRCISAATKSMCEGELVQVCERKNLDLLKERYLSIVSKKTASLFAVACQSGTLISEAHDDHIQALRSYGLNLGIAFQITDDYLDLMSEKQKLGKTPGQDLQVGEITLPLLHLLESVSNGERRELRQLIDSCSNGKSLEKIKEKLKNTDTEQKTRNVVLSYIDTAKKKIQFLSDSPYKKSLFNIADFVMDRGFSSIAC